MIKTKMVRGTSRGDDIGKIFVGGLQPETTKESLQEYFSKFGEVSDCIVMKDSVTKRSRGFGFVTFQDPTSVDNVCQNSDHILDSKKIDPKRAVPRGPGQQAVLSQQTPAGPPSKDSGANNENKIFLGGLGSNTTEEDLRTFFSSFGSKVVHVKLMYDKETNRMRGFGFVTFDSSAGVEEALRRHYHEINGKTVEAKRAEQQQPRGGGQGPNMGGGMGGAQMNTGYGRAGHYGYTQPGMAPSPMGMGRGYPGYGAMAPAYQGAAAYSGYAVGTQGVPPVYDQSSMYGPPAAQAAVAAAAFGAGYGTAPTSAAASMAVTSGAYTDYGQMPLASQATTPGAAPGAQPRLDTPAANDYSAYGLGNYPQQESSYGPARTSFSSDANSYGGYSATDQGGYGNSYGGESFGRGANATRGFHPYGR